VTPLGLPRALETQPINPFGSEMSARPSVGCDAVVHSKMRISLTAMRSQKRCAVWKLGEDAILIGMRKNGSSWEEIEAILVD